MGPQPVCWGIYHVLYHYRQKTFITLPTPAHKAGVFSLEKIIKTLFPIKNIFVIIETDTEHTFSTFSTGGEIHGGSF